MMQPSLCLLYTAWEEEEGDAPSELRLEMSDRKEGAGEAQRGSGHDPEEFPEMFRHGPDCSMRTQTHIHTMFTIIIALKD